MLQIDYKNIKMMASPSTDQTLIFSLEPGPTYQTAPGAKEAKSEHERAIKKRAHEDWLRERMHKRESEFTGSKSLLVFCGTYNVNGKKLSEPMKPWLLRGDLPPPDIYAIGFQEIVDLTVAAVLTDGQSAVRVFCCCLKVV